MHAYPTKFSKPHINTYQWCEMLQKEDTFHVFIRGSAAAFVIMKTTATVDFKAVSPEIQKEDVTCDLFLCSPHRGSVVQRGRLVKSMSLVPSQDKVLLALNPSALIKTRLTAHAEKLVHSTTRSPSHTQTRTHKNSCFDDNNLNNNTNNGDLCGAVHRPDDSQQSIIPCGQGCCLTVVPLFYHTVLFCIYFCPFLRTAVLSIMHQQTRPKHFCFVPTLLALQMWLLYCSYSVLVYNDSAHGLL